MSKAFPYRERFEQVSENKRSSIILALDLETRFRNIRYIERLIENLHPYLCAIKINFHLILPFGKKEIQSINKTIHSFGLFSIADIKLNDISNTNRVTLENLHSMGFDSVIVNPIIGQKQLKSLVDFAHKMRMGVISLVYMSHENVSEGYGLNILQGKSSRRKILPLFEIFLKYASKSNVDGIIVGATHLKALKYISSISNLPIYSPGVGTQGGNPKLAISNGSTYLIIGRSILHSKNQRKTLSNLVNTNRI
ncbi:MAG TPA: orotidine 5'-phosphate decarboxylase [Nitrososphaeraceae archaeon]|nr:orotidine 5'-phosphate decarboxylase [Nitrososphaeraceae archaeon]